MTSTKGFPGFALPARFSAAEGTLEFAATNDRVSRGGELVVVKSGAATQEVGVDAITGRVLENKAEGRNPD